MGVVTHREHIETHFSFATWILDCIWAGLPIVTTRGDALAEEVEKANIGLSVPAGDVSALVQAIEILITRGKRAIRLDPWEKLREQFWWKNVVGPLLNFCERPYTAPDKSYYLTETERISRGKDEFLQKVIHDKDDFLQKAVLPKMNSSTRRLNKKSKPIKWLRRKQRMKTNNGYLKKREWSKTFLRSATASKWLRRKQKMNINNGYLKKRG